MKISEFKHIISKQNSISAVWRNRDVDQPIEVTGFIGQDNDGRSYVSVKGSNSGVPFREIVFKKSVLNKIRQT